MDVIYKDIGLNYSFQKSKSHLTFQIKHEGLFMLLALLFFCNFIHGQNHERVERFEDCELITFNTIDRIVDEPNSLEFNALDSLIQVWIKPCGVSEILQRILIIKSIIDHRPSDTLVQNYYKAQFNSVLQNRIRDSEKLNYGYIYSDSKAYFGYVPLRHPIDKLLADVAKNLLKEKKLTLDEKLICILFSFDLQSYLKELDKKEYKNGFIKPFLQNEIRENHNKYIGYSFYTGMFRPINSDDIFANSPMVGFSFGSPLSYKLMVEIGIKVRINVNDRQFYYRAFGVENQVNSGTSIFGGGMFSYKIIELKKLILFSKLGVGIEVVDTGLSE